MQPKRRKPSHPGTILSEEFLKPLGISPAQFATQLGKGWTEKKVKDIISGKEAVSEAIAKEFAEALETTPHFWEHLQKFYTQYEVTQKQNEKGFVKPWKKAQSY